MDKPQQLPDLFIKVIDSTQFYHLLGKLDVMNKTVTEPSQVEL